MNRRDWKALVEEFGQQVCDITDKDSCGTLAEVVAAVTHRRRGVLVDLGCGIGTFIARFGEHFRGVIGVDYCQAMIERAKCTCAQLGHAKWICADIPKAADRLKGTGDVTACLNVITSPSAARRNAIWAGVSKVTKLGGRAIVVVPALESADYVAKHVDGTQRERSKGRGRRGLVFQAGATQKFFLASEVVQLMENHGFAQVRVRGIRYPWSEEGLPDAEMHRRALPWDWLAVGVRKT